MAVSSLPITKLPQDAEFTRDILAANFRIISRHTQDMEEWTAMAEEIFQETSKALELFAKKLENAPKKTSGNKKLLIFAAGVYVGVKLSDRRTRQRIQKRFEELSQQLREAAENAQQAAKEQAAPVKEKVDSFGNPENQVSPKS